MLVHIEQCFCFVLYMLSSSYENKPLFFHSDQNIKSTQSDKGLGGWKLKLKLNHSVRAGYGGVTHKRVI